MTTCEVCGSEPVLRTVEIEKTETRRADRFVQLALGARCIRFLFSTEP